MKFSNEIMNQTGCWKDIKLMECKGRSGERDQKINIFIEK